MKMVGNCTVGELEGGGSGFSVEGGGRTVVVGVRLDSQSRALLTWALIKIVHPGDRVIALHVLDPTSDIEGTSPLLSLVKTFDSVLSVYEGFCNLKQVDLKLKVCRGLSVSKILVREAKSYAAGKVIVGTSQTPHTIRSSVSVAKYCARKLPKSFCVLAVDDGRIVFQREATAANIDSSRDYDQQKSLIRSIHRSLSKNQKVSYDSTAVGAMEKSDQVHHHLRQSGSLCRRNPLGKKILNCAPDSVLLDNSCMLCRDGKDGEEENSLVLVPIQMPETQGSPELKPEWPLLRRVFLRNRHSSDSTSVRKMSLFQWLLKLPKRHSSAVVYPDRKQTNSDQGEDHCSYLDGENGGIVPVGLDAALPPLSPYNGSENLPKELEDFHEKYTSTCRLFSYQELLSVTLNFKPGNMVGKGGSSWVYKGSLPDGKELAVKMLKPSEDVLKEFVSEVEIITTLSHKNVVSLFGFCFEDNNLFLVYDFLSRGSLEENLHGNKKDCSSFCWGERYKVAVSVAEALDYLHNGIDQPVIHRDVKSSNILLCDDFEPQLSDFGLAQWASTSSNISCTDVAGTFGYLAPEYFMHGKVTDKIDVYAFGVVLLELLSGRKPISSQTPKGQESLVMWARPILNGGKVSHLLDPSLGSKYDSDQIERMVLAATLCIRRAPQLRPRISLVLKLLQGDAEVTKWARQQVSAPEELDSVDGETFHSNIQTHLNLALLDLEDDSLSISSTEQIISLEDYLQGDGVAHQVLTSHISIRLQNRHVSISLFV